MPPAPDEITPFRKAPRDAGAAAATRARTRAQEDYLRHLVHRQAVDVPPAARALFLAPHPDDIVLGCGGTLLKMLARGIRVRLAYLTDGRTTAPPEGEEAMAKRRADEARAVSRHLGLPEPIFVAWNERTFTAPENRAALVERLQGILAEVQPDHVFLPYFADMHGDHRYTNHLLAGAMRASGRMPVVYGYEVWSVAPPGVVVDITQELEEKLRLIGHYRSQLELLDYLAIAEGVARLRAPLAPGAAACEVFCPFRGEAFVELVESLDLESPTTLETRFVLTPPETLPTLATS